MIVLVLQKEVQAARMKMVAGPSVVIARKSVSLIDMGPRNVKGLKPGGVMRKSKSRLVCEFSTRLRSLVS